jgi:predicted transposase YbfD/YdcC
MKSYIDDKKYKKQCLTWKRLLVAITAVLRRYWITNDIARLPQAKDWPGLKSIGMVEYEKIEKSTGTITTERRCFISSLEAKAKPFAQAVRQYWGIENGLHWCLDVAFNEDACRICKQESTAKVGIKNKRLIAGWDHKYLAKLLELRNVG